MARTIKTKTCTKSGQVLPATPEFFYRDKSQKDGLSPWSKQAERDYNKAYRAGLKKAEASKKAVIENDDALAAFEATMAPERVTRRKGTESKSEQVVKKAAAKATTKARKTARKTKKAAKA